MAEPGMPGSNLRDGPAVVRPVDISKMVFVFGSNEAGIHGAGAAKFALKHKGAIWGKGFGYRGSSFAIPTKDKNIQTLPLEAVQRYIEMFLAFAKRFKVYAK